jgi:hypothetical protein
VPGCDKSCPSPTMILVISNDHGATWAAPKQIATPGTGQWDAQIVVDPILAQRGRWWWSTAPMPERTSRFWWCGVMMYT